MSTKNNNNNNNTKSKKEKKAKARNKAPGGGKKGRVPRPVGRALAAELAHVFEARGRSMRFPDGSDLPSIPMRNFTRGLITTDATGDMAFYCLPGRLTQCVSSTTTITSSVVTAVSMLDASDYANINATTTKFRVNAAYLRLTYVHNDLENQGRLAVKYWVSNSADPATMPLDMPTYYGSSALEMMYGTVREGATMAVPPTDLRSRLYKAPSSTALVDAFGHPGVFVYIAGAKPSTVVMEYELVQELEVIPDSNHFIPRMAGEPPADNPVYRSEVSEAYHALRGSGQMIQPVGSFEAYTQNITKFFSGLSVDDIGRAIDIGTTVLSTFRHRRSAGTGGSPSSDYVLT